LHLVGFVIRIYHDAWSPECQVCLSILFGVWISGGLAIYCTVIMFCCYPVLWL